MPFLPPNQQRQSTEGKSDLPVRHLDINLFYVYGHAPLGVCKSKVYGYSSSQSNLPHRYGNSHATWDHTQCYLPPGTGDIPAFTPAEASTRFSDPRGMQG